MEIRYSSGPSPVPPATHTALLEEVVTCNPQRQSMLGHGLHGTVADVAATGTRSVRAEARMSGQSGGRDIACPVTGSSSSHSSMNIC